MQDGEQPNTVTPGGQWSYTPESADTPTSPQTGAEPGSQVVWTASEFIAHDKTTGWYAALGAAAGLMSLAVYLLTRDKISTAMVLIAAAAFGALAARKPRELTYSLDAHGLQVGDKFYPYMDFRSFSVMEEGAIHSITLMPLRRFMPLLTIYYDPADEDKIVNALSDMLPHEDRQHDMVERLMRRLRF